jgi:hypothetical protein
MDYDIKICKTTSDPTNSKQIGWGENVWRIFGCMKPVLSLIGKSYMFDIDKKQATDGWEIPFEIISGTEKIIIMKFILF